MARAFAERLGAGARVAVGRDPRRSGPALSGAVFEGLAQGGAAEVADCGLATTPSMFMSCVTLGYGYDGAIMLTASHLPPERNGLKFFTARGGFSKRDVGEMLDAAAAAGAAAGAAAADVRAVDFMAVYAQQLRDLIKRGVQHPDAFDRPLEGLTVAVNAGNGSGGFFATEVLAPLGADVSPSINQAPDGDFPAHPPNPEDAEAMARTVEAVRASGADLGVVFDTDVDRSGVVDATGEVFNRNRLIAALAAIVLREHPGTTVVTDSVTSAGLTRFIEGRGGRHCRFKRGYKNVIDKGVELNAAGEETHLMIETSGHGAMKENYFLDDGCYLVVKLLIEVVRARLEGRCPPGRDPIAALIDGYVDPAEERELRLRIVAEDFVAAGARVIAALRGFVADDLCPYQDWAPEAVNHEGFRVRVEEGPEAGQEGWFLLRQSLHDPVLVLNLESSVPGGVAATEARLRPFFECFAADLGPIAW